MKRADVAARSQDVIEKHSCRLIVVRGQVDLVIEQVERLLQFEQRTSWTAFESAQAQLIVYLRRAERQVEALRNVEAGRVIDLEQELYVTWDELALATQRLIGRTRELTELNGK